MTALGPWLMIRHPTQVAMAVMFTRMKSEMKNSNDVSIKVSQLLEDSPIKKGDLSMLVIPTGSYNGNLILLGTLGDLSWSGMLLTMLHQTQCSCGWMRYVLWSILALTEANIQQNVFVNKHELAKLKLSESLEKVLWKVRERSEKGQRKDSERQ